MQTRDWMSYIGMITGVIGAISGIAGAVMGYISYRRSNKLKSLDLRLELRRALNHLHQSTRDISELISNADQSRMGVAAARGYFQSGAMQKWKEAVEADKPELAKMVKDAPAVEEDFEAWATARLESKLVEIHRTQGRLNSIRGKYESSLRSDDEEQKQIRQEHRINPLGR